MRALVRRAEQSEAVLASGAREVVIGDLRDAESVARAMRGVAGVFYIAPAFQPDEVALGKATVAAAVAAGVGRIVFSSVIHPMISALSNHVAKLPVEEAIVDCGIPYVILQPAMFFQTLVPFWPAVVREQVFCEPWSAETRLSRVDYRDVADLAAAAMAEDRLLNGTYQLAAPGWHNRHDVAGMMSDVLGVPVSAGVADRAAALARIGSPEQSEGRRRMFAWYDTHHALGNSLTLEAALGRAPRTLVRFLEEMRDGFPP